MVIDGDSSFLCSYVQFTQDDYIEQVGPIRMQYKTRYVELQWHHYTLCLKNWANLCCVVILQWTKVQVLSIKYMDSSIQK